MFKARLISGIILVLLALGTIIPGGWILYVAIFLVSLVGIREWSQAFAHPSIPSASKGGEDEKKSISTGQRQGSTAESSGNLLIGQGGVLGWVGSIFAVLYFVSINPGFPLPDIGMNYFAVLIMVFVIVLMCAYVFTYPKYSTEQIFTTFFGFFYVVVMLSFVYLIRMLPGGVFFVWLIFLCSWGSDTSAYCVGLTIGKRKLAPVLSPKKSVEGAIGGVVGSALLSVLYAVAINQFAGAHVNVLHFGIVGAVGSGVAQIGDLAASAIKRSHGIKDFGKLIPGHGGVLDRFDSVIFTAPIIYLLTVILVV